MIDDIIKKVELHKSRAKSALTEIKNWSSLSSDIFDDFEKIKKLSILLYIDS